MQSLGVPVEELKRYSDRVPQHEFLQVVHVDLECEARSPCGARILRTDSDMVVNIVDALIENQVVIRHVHMAVVVDPGRVDCFLRTDDRGFLQNSLLMWLSDLTLTPLDIARMIAVKWGGHVLGIGVGRSE